jgi:hypothetical protein
VRRIAATLIVLSLGAPALAADDSGCKVSLTSTDAGGVATYSSECRWPVAARRVAEVIGDRKRLAEASSSLAESTKLPDGRVVNVISPGWPIDDRQSTLTIERTPLSEGGLLLAYTLAPVQVPLGPGRVQTRRDDGRWEIRSDGHGGCLVRYDASFDAGGSLPLSVVQRAMPQRVAKSLREVRAAAEAVARADRTRADGN